jgi:hypothetical protein
MAEYFAEAGQCRGHHPATTPRPSRNLCHRSGGNAVQNDFIGVDAMDAKALGNNTGVQISNGASNNSLTNDVVSGNFINGVVITDPATTGNFLMNDHFGTDFTNKLNLGNGAAGVLIENQASGTSVWFSTLVNNGDVGIRTINAPNNQIPPADMPEGVYGDHFFNNKAGNVDND